MSCEYAQKHYGVPACIGRRVEYKGRPGIISEDRGHHIGITFDDQKPGTVSSFHPTTEGLTYLETMGTVRKMTRSQERYQRYLDLADCFDSFRDFLGWEADQARERKEIRLYGFALS